jgi:hypothetical protein
MAGAHRKVGRMPVYAGCGLEPILTRAQRRGSVSQDRFRAIVASVFCFPFLFACCGVKSSGPLQRLLSKTRALSSMMLLGLSFYRLEGLEPPNTMFYAMSKRRTATSGPISLFESFLDPGICSGRAPLLPKHSSPLRQFKFFCFFGVGVGSLLS